MCGCIGATPSVSLTWCATWNILIKVPSCYWFLLWRAGRRCLPCCSKHAPPGWRVIHVEIGSEISISTAFTLLLPLSGANAGQRYIPFILFLCLLISCIKVIHDGRQIFPWRIKKSFQLFRCNQHIVLSASLLRWSCWGWKSWQKEKQSVSTGYWFQSCSELTCSAICEAFVPPIVTCLWKFNETFSHPNILYFR